MRRPASCSVHRILQYRPSEHHSAVVWTLKGRDWKETRQPATTIRTKRSAKSLFHRHVLDHFLPAQFPESVSPGYAKFALYSFGSCVAGSAAMVLSTQTLLLAVGVTGSHESASVMAGAVNWVLKDFMGQLGGVLFASQMGKTRQFDSAPKTWRVVSAASLDVANLVEILAPFVTQHLVLPLACGANILKNIGFLTAGASRAALHQSLAKGGQVEDDYTGGAVIGGNLADVTAKAGAQSMAAGLVGTALGIGMSSFVLGDSPINFIYGFCFLSGIHQGCNYQSLKHVHLNYFNHQRLMILLGHYVERREVMSPLEVAQNESYLAHFIGSSAWLRVGSCIQVLTPEGPLETIESENYVLKRGDNGCIHITFWETARAQDLLRGVLHAHLLKTMGGEPKGESYEALQSSFDSFLRDLKDRGWVLNSTQIEPSTAVRLAGLPTETLDDP